MPRIYPRLGYRDDPYPYQGEDSFGGGPQYSPNWSDSDPYQQFQQNRSWAADRGNRIDQGLMDDQVYRRGMENQYRGWANTAYADLYNNPGYSEDELNNIIRQSQYEGGMTTDDQFRRMGPTDQEYGGMAGNPNDYYNWFDPEAMYGADTAAAEQQRNAVNLGEAGMRGAVDAQRSALNSALDDPELRTSQAYGDNMDAVLNTTGERLDTNYDRTAGALNAAAGNDSLGMDSGAARKMDMTDAEVEQAGRAAARNLGLRYQSAVGDLERRAAESGNASPLAVGAARARLENQGAAGAADALVDAELAARREQRDAAGTSERTRLQAEQYRTGAQLQAGTTLGQIGQQGAEYEGDLARGVTQGKEDTRQRANQYLTSQRVNAANSVAGNQLDAEGRVMGTRTGVEQGIGNTANSTQRYVQTRGGDIAQAVENTNANRQASLYGIRRGNQQYQNDTRYGQNYQTQGAISRGYQTGADAGRADRQEARGYWTGQTNNNANYGQQNTGYRIQNYGTQGGLQNQATAGYGQYDLGRRQGRPSVFSRVTGALTGAATGYASGGFIGAGMGAASGASGRG